MIAALEQDKTERMFLLVQTLRHRQRLRGMNPPVGGAMQEQYRSTTIELVRPPHGGSFSKLGLPVLRVIGDHLLENIGHVRSAFSVIEEIGQTGFHDGSSNAVRTESARKVIMPPRLTPYIPMRVESV